MERGGTGAWLKPHLALTQGLCWSLRRRPEEALEQLKRAEKLSSDEPLLQRALLEEAAFARLAGGIRTGRTPLSKDPDNENAAGLEGFVGDGTDPGGKWSREVDDPVRRLQRLMPGRTMPPAWRNVVVAGGGDPAEAGRYR